MISRNVAYSLRPTVLHQAQKVAGKTVTTKAVPQVAKQVAEHAKLAVPTDSAWYKLKKGFINFISNIDYNKAEVHSLTEEMAAKLQPGLKSGDILLRRTEGTSGNWFIPSWWKHAGVYVGEGEVVEATFKGIHKTSFGHFMSDGDAVMIVRAKNLNPAQRQTVAAYAERQIGRPYDFDFNFSDEARQSCTELANNAVKAGAGKELVKKNWVSSVTGDAFMNDNFRLVWTSHPERSRWTSTST